jgi:hypothetical protein
VCARLPRFGFERACFRPNVKPEECLLLPGHSVVELLKRCSRTEACRDDYVCMRTPYLPPDQGACEPPYFLAQARVDHAPIDN